MAALVVLPDRFERLQAEDLRVATAAYRLAVANETFCKPVLKPQLGFVTHSIAQYQRADRDAAAQRFGLGRYVGVMAVVDGSPAQNAGLLAGDQLLSINGHAFAEHGVAGDPSRESVDNVQRMLVEAMQRGPVTLRVSSPRRERDVRFTADRGCPSTVELIPGEEVNAWADGSRVVISEGLLRRCATDDDLALVIGHEMAHNLLHHRRRLAAEGVVANGLLPLTAAASNDIRATEEEADRYAVGLATRGGYDLSGVEAFIGALMTPQATVAMTHPDLPRRLTLLRAAIADTKRGVGAVIFSD